MDCWQVPFHSVLVHSSLTNAFFLRGLLFCSQNPLSDVLSGERGNQSRIGGCSLLSHLERQPSQSQQFFLRSRWAVTWLSGSENVHWSNFEERCQINWLGSSRNAWAIASGESPRGEGLSLAIGLESSLLPKVEETAEWMEDFGSLLFQWMDKNNKKADKAGLSSLFKCCGHFCVSSSHSAAVTLRRPSTTWAGPVLFLIYSPLDGHPLWRGKDNASQGVALLCMVLGISTF